MSKPAPAGSFGPLRLGLRAREPEPPAQRARSVLQRPRCVGERAQRGGRVKGPASPEVRLRPASPRCRRRRKRHARGYSDADGCVHRLISTKAMASKRGPWPWSTAGNLQGGLPSPALSGSGGGGRRPASSAFRPLSPSRCRSPATSILTVLALRSGLPRSPCRFTYNYKPDIPRGTHRISMNSTEMISRGRGRYVEAPATATDTAPDQVFAACLR